MNTLREMRKALQGKYAWPGGYPLYGILSDGGAICCECAVKEWRQLYVACTYAGYGHGGWRLVGVGVNWEDPTLLCDHCGERIESAYVEEGVDQ